MSKRLFFRFGGVIAFTLIVLFSSCALSFVREDKAAPVITGFSIEPDFIDTTLGDQAITVTISLTDDLSGIDWFEVSFSPDNAPRQQVGFVRGGYSNQTTEVTWTEVLTISQYQALGRWELRMIAYRDKAGNFDYQYPRQICGQWPGRCFNETVVETEFFNGYVPRKYYLPLVGWAWWCRGNDCSNR